MPGQRGTKKQRRRSGGRLARGKKAFSPNAFAALLPSVRRDIDRRLTDLLREKQDETQGLGSPVKDMIRAVFELSARGGKRLRPALVVTGFRAASGRLDLKPTLHCGVSLELLHSYFLIHDDWIDGDALRRGGPSVHAALGRRYRSARIGAASAILAGDYALALATEVLAKLELPHRQQQQLFLCFSQMQQNAIAGQQLDLLGNSKDIERCYALKTSSYTVEGPLKLGAILAGGSNRLFSVLEQFARPAGIAFQLRDDLIGVFGNPARTGKPFGSDLRAGKRTSLVTLGLSHTRGKQHAQLKSVLGNARASDRQIQAAVELLDGCGAAQIVEDRIAQLSDEALAVLKAPVLTRQGRELLKGAVRALTARSS